MDATEKKAFDEWIEDNGGESGVLYMTFCDVELEKIFLTAYERGKEAGVEPLGIWTEIQKTLAESKMDKVCLFAFNELAVFVDWFAESKEMRTQKVCRVLKDELKDRISMALKDPILQQGFEIICKENAELGKHNEELIALINAERERQEKCDDVRLRKIADLENENAELKDNFKIAKDNEYEYSSLLTKAKEIIKGLLELGSIGDGDYTYVAEAEQFLKEIDK